MISEDLYSEEFGGSDLETFEDEGNNEVAIGDNAEEPVSAENEENTSKQPVKPKRVLRNPQPKLNEETLRGKRGLVSLESYFDRVKYKGRGYEEQNLAVILKTYEYWCHRLFPKYPFDECIAKIEKLGSKRGVVTHIKRIRMDIVCDDEPVINDDDNEPVINDDDNDSIPENNLSDRFDDLFVPTVERPTELTAEQEEQIRINREQAQKRRQEKQRKANDNSSTLTDVQNAEDHDLLAVAASDNENVSETIT